jgi:hypothetical protein
LFSALLALGLRFIVLFALVVCFESCGPTYDHVVVVVDVANVLPDIQSIQASAALNGVAAMQGMNITGQLTPFVVQIPYNPTNVGTLAIELAALSPDGCKEEVGRVGVTLVSGQYQYEVTANLTVLPTKMCTLTVNVSGNGQVTSSPAGINCGSVCTFDFAIGTSMLLTALPLAQSPAVPSWSGACSGSAAMPCMVTVMKPQMVGATFPSNCYGPHTKLTVSNGSDWLGTADFNGDGNLDLVNLSGYTATPALDVLLGNGQGGFTKTASSPITLPMDPYGATIGDFNGDMKLDLAVINVYSGTLGILLGNGMGGFVSSNFPTSASAPAGIVSGDFNNDSKLDLAFTDNTLGQVFVLLGNGTGGFNAAPNSPFSVGNGPGLIAAGDVNGS